MNNGMRDKQKILFVDDEPSILNGLRRLLHRMRDEWDMKFITTGTEAIELMKETEFDVIVSDMRMPGMDGAQLLEKVREEHPGVVRLVLSGYSDKEMVLRSVGLAHQFLTKPCDAESLVLIVKRSCVLRELLNGDRLRETIGRVDALPALPEVYADLMRALLDENVTVADIGGIISRDVGISAKMLQLVNSAFFGQRQRIDDPSRAVIYLGIDTVKSLVLAASVFSTFEATAVKEFSIDSLERHSLRVGRIASALARDNGSSMPDRDDVFCAGILHDVGKLILIASFPTQFREIQDRLKTSGSTTSQVEQELLGACHSQLGGYMLGLWGLYDPIVEAVSMHHVPSLCPHRNLCALTFVHVAEQLEYELSAMPGETIRPEYDMNYLHEVGIADRLPQWKEIAAAVIHGEEAVPAEAP